MAKAAKISVTVDGLTLEEVKRLAGKDVNLSAILSEALKKHLKRLQLLAILDQWEREDPSTPEERAAGERLWQAMQSSSIPAHFPRSRKAIKRSSTRSRKT